MQLLLRHGGGRKGPESVPGALAHSRPIFGPPAPVICTTRPRTALRGAHGAVIQNHVCLAGTPRRSRVTLTLTFKITPTRERMLKGTVTLKQHSRPGPATIFDKIGVPTLQQSLSFTSTSSATAERTSLTTGVSVSSTNQCRSGGSSRDLLIAQRGPSPLVVLGVPPQRLLHANGFQRAQ